MVQVDASHYFARYDTKDRFVSYWHQIDEIQKVHPESLLEIGPGNKTVAEYLQSRGYDVTTADWDPALQPSVAADMNRLPFRDAAFDCVACFEVLEHLPFEQVTRALREMKRVARRHVIISVPDASRCYPFSGVIPYLDRIAFMVDASFLPGRRHTFDGQHYWEIGKRGFPLSRVRALFEEAGLRLDYTYRVFENPYHRFFRLSVPESGGTASPPDAGRPAAPA